MLWQMAVALVVAGLFLLQGPRAAVAALLGGACLASGTALMALRMFAGPVRVGAGMALADLLVGMGLKWLMVIVGLYLLIGLWHFPPLAVLAGMGAAMAVVVAGLRFKEQA
ncbi:MAG TPA: ATP synthase subunit I [Rhodanobacteraceae bacterium]|nr:ATP synthase subunit I [Rhodanobacteraceae bacterium]